jgi:hypothetical protein
MRDANIGYIGQINVLYKQQRDGGQVAAAA